jgi:mevalonate kinase
VTSHVGHGRTVAKVILFGEHAVVYGHPAIALPLRSLFMTARVEPVDGPSTLTGLGWSGLLSDAPDRFASIVKAAEIASRFARHPGVGLQITTDANFPPERGLGSSAAAAGAVIRAVLDAFDTTATSAEIFELTQEAETVAHGRPSGLDAVTTSSEVPVYFREGQATELEVVPQAWIVIADSGVEGATREAVAHVRQRHDEDPTVTTEVLHRLGSITDLVVDSLGAGDSAEVGRKMNEAQRLLAGLGVSDPSLDRLVDAAVQAGALGAKLTGGGRGGCMIALAGSGEDARRIEDALLAAGAAAAWVHVPERTGSAVTEEAK